MKQITIFLFCICTLSINAQLEYTNLDKVLIDQNEATQRADLDLINNSANEVKFDWQIEYLGTTQSFLQISVSDINNDYTPQVTTNCDLMNTTNTLGASASYTMGLHFRLDEIPSNVDKDAVLAYYNLYASDNCLVDTLLSLPIVFENSTNTIQIEDQESLELYPNPVSQYLYFNQDNFSNNDYLEVYNYQGIRYDKIKLNKSPIDLSYLPNGYYIFKINTLSKAFVKLE